MNTFASSTPGSLNFAQKRNSPANNLLGGPLSVAGGRIGRVPERPPCGHPDGPLPAECKRIERYKAGCMYDIYSGWECPFRRSDLAGRTWRPLAAAPSDWQCTLLVINFWTCVDGLQCAALFEWCGMSTTAQKTPYIFVMCDVWCVICDVWCVISDLWCVMCDVWFIIFYLLAMTARTYYQLSITCQLLSTIYYVLSTIYYLLYTIYYLLLTIYYILISNTY